MNCSVTSKVRAMHQAEDGRIGNFIPTLNFKGTVPGQSRSERAVIRSREFVQRVSDRNFGKGH